MIRYFLHDQVPVVWIKYVLHDQVPTARSDSYCIKHLASEWSGSY
jgi:hypothetical protein